MNIEDFLADRAGSGFEVIYSNPEYKRCRDKLSELYELVKLNLEGETIVNEIKSLHNRINGIINMYLYKRGFKDGLKLGWLLAEVKDTHDLED